MVVFEFPFRAINTSSLHPPPNEEHFKKKKKRQAPQPPVRGCSKKPDEAFPLAKTPQDPKGKRRHLLISRHANEVSEAGFVFDLFLLLLILLILSYSYSSTK